MCGVMIALLCFKGFNWMTCHFGLTTKYLTTWAACIWSTVKPLKIRNPRLLTTRMHKLPKACQGLPGWASHLRFVVEVLGTKQTGLWIQKTDLIARLAFLPKVGQVAGRLMPCLLSLSSSLALSWLCSLQRIPASSATAVAQIYRSTPD